MRGDDWEWAWRGLVGHGNVRHLIGTIHGCSFGDKS